MRRSIATVVFAGMLLGARWAALAEDPPKQPPAAPAPAGLTPWQRSAETLFRKAEGALARGDFDVALRTRREAIDLLKSEAPDSEDYAYALAHLGRTLHAAGRAVEAIPVYEEAEACFRGLFPGDDTRSAGIAGMRGFMLREAGRAVEALSVLEASLAEFSRLGRTEGEDYATVLNNLALALEDAGRYADALPRKEESLALRRRLLGGDHPYVALALNNLAATLEALGRGTDAIPLLEEAVAMSRRLAPEGDDATARGLMNLGHNLHMESRFDDARAALEESVGLYRRLYPTGHPNLAFSLHGLSLFHSQTGRLAEALPLQEESLAIFRRFLPPDHPHLAVSLGNLAGTLRDMGRAADALPLQEEAVRRARRNPGGDHPVVAGVLRGLAGVHAALGRREEALPLHEEALAIFRRLFPDDHPHIADQLQNVAMTLVELERAEEAMPVQEEATAMCRRLYTGDHVSVAAGLGSLGGIFRSLGRHAESIAPFEESLAMFRRLFPEGHMRVAGASNNLGMALESLGRDEEALAALEDAYAMGRRIGHADRHLWGTNLGALLLRLGRPDDALAPLEDALATIETLRGAAAALRTEERSLLVDSLQRLADPVALLVRAHMQRGDPSAAFETLERGRGREMLDLLARSRWDPVEEAKKRLREAGDTEGMAHLEAAEARRNAAEVDVARRRAAVERETVAGKLSRGEIRALREAEAVARRELLDALRDIQRLVRDVLPAARPRPLREVQALLGPGDRILAYSIGSEASYAFLLGPPGTDVWASELRFAGRGIGVRDVAGAVAAYREWISDPKRPFDGAAVAHGRKLFAWLFPEPLWAAVKDAERVHVLSHGALHALPFESLVVDGAEGSYRFFVEVGPPLSYQPSASVLAWLAEGRTPRVEAPSLVALGDPVFAGAAVPAPWPDRGVLLAEVRRDGQGDRLGLRPGDVLVAYDGKEVLDPPGLRARLQEAGAGRADIEIRFVREGERLVVRAASGPLGVVVALEPPPVSGPKLLEGESQATLLRQSTDRGRRLGPLPGTRVEVEAIARIFQERFGSTARVETLLGSQSRESTLFRAAQGARYLHLATHGLLDETSTASFSALALTMPRVPVAGDDGFLTLVDLMQHWRGRLAATDLVVLSACESTKGALRRDEGMYALPWGFLFAGAPAVVGSLWRVDDASTAHLMTEFYRRLLEDGGDALSALVAARRATRVAFPHPHHWAAFVFTGVSN